MPQRNAKPSRQIACLEQAAVLATSLVWTAIVLLIISFVVGNKARTQRDAALRELEALKQDNSKLAQYLEERNQDLEKANKALEACKSKAKTKAKPAAKSKPKSKTAKKKTTK